MAQITASLVKELRDKTGAGMMDCKRALTETGGDLEQAVDWLRKKGLSAAARKAGRVAAEGLIGISVSDAAGAVVEVNAETDFVARNEEFQDFVRTVAEVAGTVGGDLERLKAAPYPGGASVGERLTEMIGRIGENLVVRRAAAVTVGTGVVASYVHNAAAPGLGKIGVLVGLDSAGDKEALAAFGKQLAMHIAAARPEAVSRDDVDPALLARERDILAAQARASGKPEAIIDKMVEGRLRKFYEDVVLTEQTFVIDGESRVGDAIAKAADAAGAPITVAAMVRFELGEGIEKEASDFAADVAAQARR
ncbi:MAG TPA: translation elongation factor Ts [Alphaproteobacteria bacterium]